MNWLKKFFKFREKSDGDVVKPFLDHMEDLRWMFIKCIITLVIAMAVSFIWVDDLMILLQAPLDAVDPNLKGKVITRKIVDAFVISFQLAFFAGIVLSLPLLLYFVAGFVLPALTRKEKKFLFPGIFCSFVLFLGGVLVSYYYLLPQTLKFFYWYAKKKKLEILWEWRDYLSFTTWLTVGFGLLCQLPIVVMVLSLFGIIDYKFLAKTRSYAITIILILTAVVAPTPDPMTFLSLGAPVILLYEGCIWIVWLLDRRKARREQEERDRLDDRDDKPRDDAPRD
jgi:sec-independent protein translocase protein TatC